MIRFLCRVYWTWVVVWATFKALTKHTPQVWRESADRIEPILRRHGLL